MTDNQARDLLLDLAYQTDAQVLGLARNIIGPDCTSLPGTGWDGDSLTLTNRRLFVTWLITRNADLPDDEIENMDLKRVQAALRDQGVNYRAGIERVRALVVRQIMEGAGYEAVSTGGPCWAWSKDLGDGTSVWICTEGNELYGDPLATDWLITRYREDDFEQLDDVVSLYDALTLEVIFASRPVPQDQTGIRLDDIEEDLLAQRWVNKLGLFFNLDKDGHEYSPRLSAEEIAQYDNDVHVLCRVSADPQDAVLRAQKRNGLLDGHEPSYITLEQFRASRIRVADLKLYLAEDVLEDHPGPVPGYLYLGCTYIREQGGEYNLILGNCEWNTNDLGQLEQRLYDWCKGEQIRAVEV